MPRLRANDRLAPEDAIFLYLENQQMPLHIGSVSIFEGRIALSECLNLVESKLPRIPRYRQRIVTPPWHIGHPTWEYDPGFDIHHHVRHVVLKRGTQAELRAVAGKVFSQVMDRARPLWDLTLVEGLQGGRTALIGRVHHCLADGVSGSAILNIILDPRPAAPPDSEKKKSFRAPSLPDQGTSLVNTLLTSLPEMANQILSAQAEALAVGAGVVGASEQRAFRDLAPFLPELLAPVERLPFNQPCAGPRKVAWTEIPMADAKAIKETYGTTLNDVVLTVLASAVQRYAKLHGVALKKRLLRVMVPVSLRHEEENRPGNRVSMVPISIPLDIHNPVKLLRAIHRRTEALKGAHVAEVVKLISTWMGIVPVPFQTVLSTLAMPVPPFNMVCTNVPGPQTPLYLLGHRMLSSHPYVPIGNGMGVNCAVQSYNGTLYFGLTGDAVAAPDLSRLNKFLHSSFLDLRNSARSSPVERSNPPEEAPGPRKEGATLPARRGEPAEPMPPARAEGNAKARSERVARTATAA